MNKRGFLIVVFFTFCFLLTVGADEAGVSVRAAGMAKAFVAMSDDVGALAANPAGLVQVESLEATTQHGQFLKGLSDASDIESGYFGYVHPIKRGQAGTVGLGYHQFKGANYFSDRLFSLGYGRKLSDTAFGMEGQWSLGSTVRLRRRQYESGPYTANALNEAGIASGKADPLFSQNGYKKDGYDVDLGALYQFGKEKRYRFGVALRNVNRADVSLGGEGDKAPLMTAAGMAYRPTWGALSAELRRAKRLTGAIDTDAAVGAERKASFGKTGTLALRAGYEQGSRGFTSLATGMSLRVSNIQFDYAFSLPIGQSAVNQASHQVAFTFRWASLSPEANGPLTARKPQNYSDSLRYYFHAKAQGASTEERLALLQSLYERYQNSGLDLKWFIGELSSL